MLKSLMEMGFLFRPIDGLTIELEQARDEGKDISDSLMNVSEIMEMDDGVQKEIKLLEFYEQIQKSPLRNGYSYVEPSDLEEIKRERPAKKEALRAVTDSKDMLYDKMYGAWLGRCAGCLLGKPVEFWKRDRIVGMAKDTNNYPIQYYFSSDVDKGIREKYEISDKFLFKAWGVDTNAWINNVGCMPIDDDTNYTVLGLKIVEDYGKEFNSDDVADAWMNLLPAFAVMTAERAAYRNIVCGMFPPKTGYYMNPYREWLGAQIRADFFGYVNPGNPEKAAEFAFCDASISHVKNGIYGEMFMAAMIAAAATEDEMIKVITAGLAEIPENSRTAEGIRRVLEWNKEAKPFEYIIDTIHNEYDESNMYHWCHTVPNAMIITASLLYGENDLEKTISNAILAAFDTDCNGASVGSVVGMMLGAKALPAKWVSPLNDRLITNVAGYLDVKISDMAKKTVELICE